MILKMSDMSTLEAYHTLTQVVVPRPVAWVLSENAGGGLNLAPFSFFAAVCSDPPVVMLSIGASKPDGSEKDTYTNIIAQERFVIHIAGAELAHDVSQSAASLPHGESELDFCDLQTTEFEGFALPRVVGPKVALGCTLYQQQDIGNRRQHLVFGQVETIWLDDSVVTEDAKGRRKIDAAAMSPISRLGGIEYLTPGEIIAVPRPE